MLFSILIPSASFAICEKKLISTDIFLILIFRERQQKLVTSKKFVAKMLFHFCILMLVHCVAFELDTKKHMWIFSPENKSMPLPIRSGSVPPEKDTKHTHNENIEKSETVCVYSFSWVCAAIKNKNSNNVVVVF